MNTVSEGQIGTERSSENCSHQLDNEVSSTAQSSVPRLSSIDTSQQVL